MYNGFEILHNSYRARIWATFGEPGKLFVRRLTSEAIFIILKIQNERSPVVFRTIVTVKNIFKVLSTLQYVAYTLSYRIGLIEKSSRNNWLVLDNYDRWPVFVFFFVIRNDQIVGGVFVSFIVRKFDNWTIKHVFHYTFNSDPTIVPTFRVYTYK